MRQREFAGHGSGSRTRHRSSDHDPQTHEWQTLTLPATDGHDGDAIRRDRPCHKGGCDTCWREILRALAADVIGKGVVTAESVGCLPRLPISARPGWPGDLVDVREPEDPSRSTPPAVRDLCR